METNNIIDANLAQEEALDKASTKTSETMQILFSMQDAYQFRNFPQN